MKVTANVLLNYLRCRRYASLNDPNADHDESEFDLASDYQIHVLRQNFIDLFLDNMEDLSINHLLSYDFHPEIELSENYDFLTHDEHGEIIYCLYPTTSKEFLKQKYNLEDHKYQLFVKNSQGAYEFNVPSIGSTSGNYSEKLRKLMDRRDDLGRLVYRYAFKRFLYEIVNPDSKTRIHLVFLNSDYVHDGGEYRNSLFHIFDFAAIYSEMREIIEADIYRVINHLELSDFIAVPLVKKECRKDDTFECKFIDFCFSHVPKTNSILDYFDSHLGFDEPTDAGNIHHDIYELINEGLVDMNDIPISWLKDEKHLMQRYCIDTGNVHVNKVKIERYLQELRYPLIYLDFEALPCLLPRYSGEKPYSQSVFQYSIHIEREEGILEKNGKDHYEFISKPDQDNRRELVESMIRIINQTDSSVVVFHKTFEEQRLKEFQEIFPEHKEELQKIIDRLFDLKDVLKNNKKFYLSKGFSNQEASRYNFYSSELSGSYSLKKVIKVFNPEAYQNLTINNGVDAYKAFMNLEFMEPTDRDNAVSDLLEYCKQDTYSMFEIINGLRKYLSPDFHTR